MWLVPESVGHWCSHQTLECAWEVRRRRLAGSRRSSLPRLGCLPCRTAHVLLMVWLCGLLAGSHTRWLDGRAESGHQRDAGGHRLLRPRELRMARQDLAAEGGREWPVDRCHTRRVNSRTHSHAQIFVVRVAQGVSSFCTAHIAEILCAHFLSLLRFITSRACHVSLVD